jgi:hypothetical protein
VKGVIGLMEDARKKEKKEQQGRSPKEREKGRAIKKKEKECPQKEEGCTVKVQAFLQPPEFRITGSAGSDAVKRGVFEGRWREAHSTHRARVDGLAWRRRVWHGRLIMQQARDARLCYVILHLLFFLCIYIHKK